MPSSTDKDEKPLWYKCPYCKKLFHEREETIAHMKASHKKAMSGEYAPKAAYESAGNPGFSLPFSGKGGGW